MKKVITSLAVIAAMAIPAVASANATTDLVAHQFSVQIHNRARLSGIRITSTSVKCRGDGGGYYSCWATYTAFMRGRHFEYGAYLDITPTNWHVVGTPRLIKVF